MRALEDAMLMRWIRASLEQSHGSGVRRALNDESLNLGSAVARARLLGLKFPEDILRFSRLTALLGSEFERDPEYNWTRDYLEDWDPDVGERVARLEAEVLRRLGEDLP
jgi:hypothetical protein